MGVSERDEYEDWEEYEEDGEEQEEEEVGEDGCEKEIHQPTQDELDYLELRQRLKESIRKQMKKDLGIASADSRDKINAFRGDKYGTFFGISYPVIARRVIQESKSLLENPDLAARISNPNRTNNKSSVMDPVKSKSRDNHSPRVTDGLKRKVEILKNSRDYSLLLAEDSEISASTKCLPPRRNVSAPKTDARPAQQPPRSKQVVNDRSREAVSTGQRKPMLSSSQNKPKLGQERMTSASKSSMESRKQLGSNNGIGPERPIGPKCAPLKKNPAPSIGKTTSAIAKSTTAGGLHRPSSSSVQSAVRKPPPSHLQSGNHKPAPSRGQPSVMRKPSGVQKEYQESSKPKVATKQAPTSSRDQLKTPTSKPLARHTLADEQPKAKPKRQLHDEDSDDENPINMIRQMFGYNPKKFRDDDDDSDMEADFDQIMREEQRSTKIARREDEEQLRMIEEEKRREKMRLDKKRKLGRK